MRDEHGETVTGYDALPMPPGSDHPLYQTVFYDAEFRGEPLRMAAITLPLHDVGSARARWFGCWWPRPSSRANSSPTRS